MLTKHGRCDRLKLKSAGKCGMALLEEHRMNIYDAVYQVNQNGLARRAASIALADGGERVYTYGELFAKADAYAAALTAAGVRAGDRVALVGASSPELRISSSASTPSADKYVSSVFLSRLFIGGISTDFS